MRSFGLTFGLCLTLGATARAVSPTTVGNLSCEDIRNPLGIEEARPRLSWSITSDRRGWKQRSYQILVASSSQLLAQNKGDLWNSGSVNSNVTDHIAYTGKTLGSGAQCYWKVRVWDDAGQPSAYSAPALWQMGLLQKSDWHGQWIGYVQPQPKASQDAMSLKNASWIWYPEGDPAKNAPAGRSIQSARLRTAADNVATIFVNGQEVGSSRDSWKTRDVLDVKSQLAPSANIIAIAVVNEANAVNISPAGLAAQLDVRFTDGEVLSVVTDNSWKTSNQQVNGWQSNTFEDAAWSSAQVLAKVGGGPWGEVSNEPEIPTLPAPHLRRTFALNGRIRRATAYICGLGLYEMRLNERKVGDHVLDPGWTRYDRRALYVTHDVTKYLQNGTNALAVILGTGHFDDHVLAAWDFDKAPWRARPKMLLELRVEYQDGRHQIIKSDGSGSLVMLIAIECRRVNRRVELTAPVPRETRGNQPMAIYVSVDPVVGKPQPAQSSSTAFPQARTTTRAWRKAAGI